MPTEKIGTIGDCYKRTIYTTMYILIFVQNWLTPSCKSHLCTVQNRKIPQCYQKVGQYLTLTVYYPMVLLNLKCGISQIYWENTLFGLGCSKLKAAHPVNYFLWFWGKILRIAHPVNYAYLPPCSNLCGMTSCLTIGQLPPLIILIISLLVNITIMSLHL